MPLQNESGLAGEGVSNVGTSVPRRQFLKRSGAATAGTILAWHGSRVDVYAECSSDKMIKLDAFPSDDPIYGKRTFNGDSMLLVVTVEPGCSPSETVGHLAEEFQGVFDCSALVYSGKTVLQNPTAEEKELPYVVQVGPQWWEYSTPNYSLSCTTSLKFKINLTYDCRMDLSYLTSFRTGGGDDVISGEQFELAQLIERSPEDSGVHDPSVTVTAVVKTKVVWADDDEGISITITFPTPIGEFEVEIDPDTASSDEADKMVEASMNFDIVNP